MQERDCAANLQPLARKAEPLSFSDLPPEIILSVGDELRKNDLLSLLKCSRHLHSLLEKALLRYVAMEPWALTNGLDRTMRAPGQAHIARKMLHSGLPRWFLRELALCVGDDGLMVIEWAVCEGHTELLEKMLEAGADPDAGSGLIFERHPVPNQMLSLLQLTAMILGDVDFGKEAKYKARPLHWAACGGRLDLVRLLVRHGATVAALNRDKQTAIHVAAEHGYRDIVYFLREQETAGMGTALHDACALGLYDKARRLLVSGGGGSVSSLDEACNTPLHLAATSGGSEDLVRLLLDAGSDVTARNIAGRTPLHCVDGQFPTFVKLLLGRGASVHVQDERGATPLVRVCGPDTAPETVRLLLDAGSAANAMSTEEECALIYLDNEEIIRMLKDAGCDCDAHHKYWPGQTRGRRDGSLFRN